MSGLRHDGACPFAAMGSPIATPSPLFNTSAVFEDEVGGADAEIALDLEWSLKRDLPDRYCFCLSGRRDEEPTGARFVVQEEVAEVGAAVAEVCVVLDVRGPREVQPVGAGAAGLDLLEHCRRHLSDLREHGQIPVHVVGGERDRWLNSRALPTVGLDAQQVDRRLEDLLVFFVDEIDFAVDTRVVIHARTIRRDSDDLG